LAIRSGSETLPPFAIDDSQADFRAEARRAGKRHPSLLREDLPEIIEKLLEQPELGDQIRRLPAEVRKVRLGVRQQNLGPRGAFRLIYRVDRASRVLQLLALYYKPDIEDMSSRMIKARLSRL
jgi:hypothetical protein